MLRFKIFGLFILLMLLSTCSNNSEPINSLDFGESKVSAWQTCCASGPGRVHLWSRTNQELKIERLPLVSPTFRYGHIFELDGNLFALDRESGAQFRFDAQVGDLFVGYWPRGEIWRRHRTTGKWSLAVRLFHHPVSKEPLVPYSNREADGKSWAFYGQRVSALVPFGDSLYAATSNLGGWPTGYVGDINQRPRSRIWRNLSTDYAGLRNYRSVCFEAKNQCAI